MEKKATIQNVAPKNLTANNNAEILADALRANVTSPLDNASISRRGILADIIPVAGATETFNPATGDNFFDPGGPGGSSTSGTPGNYPNCGCDTQSTLAGVSEINFQFFSVFGNFDYLRIYDGTDASGTLLYDNGVGGPNDGDITLADMIASNGSSSFIAGSGNFLFFFHATAVVDYGGWDVEIVSAGGGGGPCTNTAIEVNQDVNDSCMALIDQGGLAQSYKPTQPNAAGAGIMFTDPSTGLDVNLSLWDGLPNAGGTMLANGTSQTDGTAWADVFWDPVVSVTVGTTYYIVIDGDITLPCVAGSLANPYPDGNVFANDYGSFPDFDYTFRTYSCNTVSVGENDLQDFSFYPNPTNGLLNLSSAENIENVKIYNVLGQMVIITRVNATNSQVDISALKTGTYLMKVLVNGEIGTYRVLKQ
ncbi:T9SS type A sorting domain-containing protein [Aequorivita sublithincola]|uniref:T9SS type A sorting domain-containing protein n=1 Tax=Aequorivita sublithincola TaxID=101385 RepID=UPI00031223B6|nr:T9SS type A sorting domain-containing protein [Aequorivita sublithincola]